MKDVKPHYHIVAFQQTHKEECAGTENRPCVEDTSSQPGLAPDLSSIIGEGSKGEVKLKNPGLDDSGTSEASNTATLKLLSPQGVKVACSFEVPLTLASVQAHDMSL